MKLNIFTLLFASSVFMMFPCSTLAHHSVSAEFDASRRVVLSGTITKVEWTNPHTFFFVDAKDPRTGHLVSWACELGSPNMLSTLGWTRGTLRVGMMVTFSGVLARDGSYRLMPRNIVADGNRIVAWPSEQNRP
jgi:Family of unknown function (DUF6152)